MDKVVIIHFLPLENYPPVMNLAGVLSSQNETPVQVTILTTLGSRKKKEFFSEEIKILRVASWRRHMSSIGRYWLYLKFNVTSLLHLVRMQPAKVLYYETLSSFPAVIYKKVFAPKAAIFIHYHEYTSKEEYRNGMFLSRFFHKMEQSIFRSAKWISHTNNERAELFKKDVNLAAEARVHELPNYPPLSWVQTASNEGKKQGKGRLVYVGALSLETMFVKEWADLILRNPDKFSLDFYSDNYAAEVFEYIQGLNEPNIRFNGSVEYNKLPEVLRGYDAGLILYKGHIPNYIYNAPNKLFEYHACGLDTFFPENMKGCLPYLTQETYPKIVALDFEKLNTEVVAQALNRDGLQYKPSPFFCEKNLPELTDQLLEHD